MSDLPEGILQTKEGFYVLKDDSHLSRWIETRHELGIQRGEVMDHFAKYIPKGGTVINAGASLGDHACLYAELVGPGGRVYAFEPNPLPFQCLKRNMLKYPWVTCGNWALGEREAVTEFTKDLNAGASHIRSVSTEPPALNKTVVDVCKLDDILPDGLKRADFIHLDAEGYEIPILIGGSKTIRKYRPVMAIEVSAHMRRYGFDEQIFRKILDGLNYSIHEIDGTPASEQRDVLCLPR